MIVALRVLLEFGYSNTQSLHQYPSLFLDIYSYVLSSLAEKTLTAYFFKLHIFLRFLKHHPHCLPQAFTESTFILYSAFRAKKVSAVTIRADFSAIASMFSFARIKIQWGKHVMPLLHRVLDGIERTQANDPNRPVDRLQPLTTDILTKFLSFLPSTLPASQMFRAILTVGTLTGLRPGELVAYSQSDIGHAAKWNQFELLPSIEHPSFLKFKLSTGSKTSSFAHSERVQTPDYAPPAPSAVREIAKWAIHAHMDPHTITFVLFVRYKYHILLIKVAFLTIVGHHNLHIYNLNLYSAGPNLVESLPNRISMLF